MPTRPGSAGDVIEDAGFVHRILAFEGGGEWLQRLPAILAACARRWHLTLAPPFPGLSYNYVAPVTLADGAPAVLKVGAPNPELVTEAAALRIFAGRAAVRLLDADADWGALLLERIWPGRMLVELRDDDRATRIAAEVMQRLWRPLPAGHEFPTLAHWFRCFQRLRQRYGGASGPFPADLLARAESLAADLLADSTDSLLLHGDLHHYNILAAGEGRWLAIDPKGVAGDPAFEVGALLKNPLDLLSWPDLDRTLARRVDILAERLPFERERIVGWGVAQALLSACWSLEDGEDWGAGVAVAQRLAGLLGGR